MLMRKANVFKQQVRIAFRRKVAGRFEQCRLQQCARILRITKLRTIARRKFYGMHVQESPEDIDWARIDCSRNGHVFQSMAGHWAVPAIERSHAADVQM